MYLFNFNEINNGYTSYKIYIIYNDNNLIIISRNKFKTKWTSIVYHFNNKNFNFSSRSKSILKKNLQIIKVRLYAK